MAQTETWKVLSEHQEILLHREGDKALAQVTQEVFLLGDI